MTEQTECDGTQEAFEAARQHHSPHREVHIGRAADGIECIYFGQIVGISMYNHHLEKRFEFVDRIPLPRPMTTDELLEWINGGPHELQTAMDAVLPNALGKTVGVTEFYLEELDDE